MGGRLTLTMHGASIGSSVEVQVSHPVRNSFY